MVPLLPLRDGVRALPISFFRQSMPSFYMNAPDCICSPGRLPLGAFCTGRDGRYGQDWPTRCGFQSTHPVRGATLLQVRGRYVQPISIHAPRAGCDPPFSIAAKIIFCISIHAPRAGCDALPRFRFCSMCNFNPRTPCGVRLRRSFLGFVFRPISIHAPRAGCDRQTQCYQRLYRQFQSTHPVRGATRNFAYVAGEDSDFNPRTPCGVRLKAAYTGLPFGKFQSTHPVRGATQEGGKGNMYNQFQSTHPVRGATKAVWLRAILITISIHAPRAGCDWSFWGTGFCFP